MSSSSILPYLTSSYLVVCILTYFFVFYPIFLILSYLILSCPILFDLILYSLRHGAVQVWYWAVRGGTKFPEVLTWPPGKNDKCGSNFALGISGAGDGRPWFWLCLVLVCRSECKHVVLMSSSFVCRSRRAPLERFLCR